MTCTSKVKDMPMLLRSWNSRTQTAQAGSVAAHGIQFVGKSTAREEGKVFTDEDKAILSSTKWHFL